METIISSTNMMVNKPCLICGATVQVPRLYGDSTNAICSECYRAIAWAKEKMKEENEDER